MRRFQRLGNLLRDRECLVERNRTVEDSIRKRRAVDEFHHQRGRGGGSFETVDGRDVGMVQRGERPGFALEAGEPIGIGSHGVWQHFDRDRAREIDVSRCINLTHAADAKERRDLVGAEATAGRERHEAILRGGGQGTKKNGDRCRTRADCSGATLCRCLGQHGPLVGEAARIVATQEERPANPTIRSV
jgi:hypothetical protein